MKFIILTLGLLVIPSIAITKTIWPTKSLKLVSDFEYPFENSFAGTIWSSCQSRKHQKLKLPAKIVNKVIKIGNRFILLPNRGI